MSIFLAVGVSRGIERPPELLVRVSSRQHANGHSALPRAVFGLALLPMLHTPAGRHLDQLAMSLSCDDLRTAAARPAFRVGVRGRNGRERSEDGADDHPVPQTRSLCERRSTVSPRRSPSKWTDACFGLTLASSFMGKTFEHPR